MLYTAICTSVSVLVDYPANAASIYSRIIRERPIWTEQGSLGKERRREMTVRRRYQGCEVKGSVVCRTQLRNSLNHLMISEPDFFLEMSCVEPESLRQRYHHGWGRSLQWRTEEKSARERVCYFHFEWTRAQSTEKPMPSPLRGCLIFFLFLILYHQVNCVFLFTN